MFSGATLVPNVLILMTGVTVLILTWFLFVVITDHNPLPFPDRDYHVYSASSTPALAVLEQLMQRFGHSPRFRIDSNQVDRTVFSNGTIINHPHPQMSASLGHPGGAMGFVVADPDRAAHEAAHLLRESGFHADVVLDAEPGLPIAFVTTNAFMSSALVFRKHLLKMGQKPPAWTPRIARVIPARSDG